MTAGFVPPPYPYERLGPLRERAAAAPGGAVDLSVGTPCDAPPAEVLAALNDAGRAAAYPPSVGTPQYREAAAAWVARRFGVDVDPAAVAACVGTKELVAGLPHWLRLRTPDRDTVLYPAISYPSYEMGAILAGCRAVPVPLDDRRRIHTDAIDPADAARALCLWVNTPGNPAGGLDDLDGAAAWGRTHGVPVASDECYAEFTWTGEPRTILHSGSEGVLAVHSLSKRSNLAGARIGFYAGDADLVHYLAEVRKHAGFMPPGPVQAAGTVAWADDAHVDEQRERYRTRLAVLRAGLERRGFEAPMPDGAFYLWVPTQDGDRDGWALADRLADHGLVGSPGEFYGEAGTNHVRLAVVQPTERLEAWADAG